MAAPQLRKAQRFVASGLPLLLGAYLRAGVGAYEDRHLYRETPGVIMFAGGYL